MTDLERWIVGQVRGHALTEHGNVVLTVRDLHEALDAAVESLIERSEVVATGATATEWTELSLSSPRTAGA